MKKVLIALLSALLVFLGGVTVASASVTRQQVLMIGDRDEWVTELQKALYDAKYLAVKPTGYFGENTQNAVIAFQKKNKIAVDGKAGPVTRKLLLGAAYKDVPDSRKVTVAAVTKLESEATALMTGDKGDEVTKAQTKLKELGYYKYSSITGYFGPITKDAVIRFQKSAGITADGVIGTMTSQKLYAPTAEAGTLSRGDSGADVKKLQTRLKELKFFSSSTTSFFGRITETALKDFQTQNGLVADGKAGTKTTALLYSDTAKSAVTDKLTEVPNETVSSKVQAFIDTAATKMGCVYVYGAEGPNTFDCSGFIYHTLRSVGVNVGRVRAITYSNMTAWTDVSTIAELKTGDLVFFSSSKSTNVSHVGIYIGNNTMIHAAPSAGCVVKQTLSGYWSKYFAKGKRIF